MIVVISDLHLQHTSRDVVRRSEGGKILETRVVRNFVNSRVVGGIQQIRMVLSFVSNGWKIQRIDV